MPGLFDPPTQPDFNLIPEHRFATTQDAFEAGYVQTRARWPNAKRRWELSWPIADKATRDYIVDFLSRQQGAAEAFSWSLPSDMLYQPKPSLKPSIWYFSGGAKSERTYYVAFTWENAVGETEVSPEDSITVPANNLLRIAVPPFPVGVTQATIYVGTATGVLYEQDTAITVSGGTWDEPASALPTATSPPTDNTMGEIVTVHLEADSFKEALVAPEVWSISIEVVELFG